jgi:hypothetical protein
VKSFVSLKTSFYIARKKESFFKQACASTPIRLASAPLKSSVETRQIANSRHFASFLTNWRRLLKKDNDQDFFALFLFWT